MPTATKKTIKRRKPLTTKEAIAKAAKMVQGEGDSSSPQLLITEINMPVMRVPIIGLTPLHMDAVPWYVKEKIRNKNFDGYEAPAPRSIKIHPIQQFCETIHNVYNTQNGQNGRAWKTHTLETPFVPPIGPNRPIRFKAKMNPGIPAVGFKSAMVSAARLIEGVTMVFVNQVVYVLGELVPIDYVSVRMSESHPKTSQGVTVVKWTAEFVEWGCDLCVMWNADAYSPADMINLINRAGNYGVLYGRPGKTKRTNGMFQVSDEAEPEMMTPRDVGKYLEGSRYSHQGAEWVDLGTWSRIVEAAKSTLSKLKKKKAAKKTVKK